jgi:site-specific recombinase
MKRLLQSFHVLVMLAMASVAAVLPLTTMAAVAGRLYDWTSGIVQKFNDAKPDYSRLNDCVDPDALQVAGHRQP